MLALPPGLDPDLLRSFVLIADGGSFTRAAQAVGRTQSAVSMQIRRLEDLLGHPLLLRGARGVEPTPHGAWLLDRARRLLAMHDEIVSTFRAPAMAGTAGCKALPGAAVTSTPSSTAPPEAARISLSARSKV